MSINVLKALFDEYRNILNILYENQFILEHREFCTKKMGEKDYSITWSGRNKDANVTFDSKLDINHIVNTLLRERQYSILFYDKSILQVEYSIKSNIIVKQRLQYIRKSNVIRSIEEINRLEREFLEVEGNHWFEDEIGTPVIIRVDYDKDPQKHIDVKHAKSHLTISNLKNCRIPMYRNLTLTRFVQFILNHVYSEYDLKLNDKFIHEDEITNNEKRVIHINWK